VVSKAEWAERPAHLAGQDEPDPIVFPGIGWGERLGQVSRGFDHWWTVWAGFPADEVAADLIAALRDGALPAMRERMAG